MQKDSFFLLLARISREHGGVQLELSHSLMSTGNIKRSITSEFTAFEQLNLSWFQLPRELSLKKAPRKRSVIALLPIRPERRTDSFPLSLRVVL